MRCPACNHNSLSTIADNDSVIVKCSNCDKKIIVESSPLSEVFIFNYDIERIKGEGKIAFLSGKKIDECPYGNYGNELAQKWWIGGYRSAEESIGVVSSSFAAIKEKEEELEETKELLRGKKDLAWEISKIWVDTYTHLMNTLAEKHIRKKTLIAVIKRILGEGQKRYKKLTGVQ